LVENTYKLVVHRFVLHMDGNIRSH